MKTLIFSFTCLLCFLVRGQSLPEVRKSFHQAVLHPEQSTDFHSFLNTATLNSATLKAYKATSEAMLAQTVWNPFTKLSLVMKYANQMEIAVGEDEDNIEIRFLRLAIEYNLPRFLGMSRHLEEDRDVIVENLNSITSMNLDPSFCRYIIYFLNDTGLVTPEEILAMKQNLVRTSLD